MSQFKLTYTAQKMKFSIKDFSSKYDQIRGKLEACDLIRQFPADLVTFTGEILNGKLHFLYSVSSKKEVISR